jgi:hypothetical protein
MIAEVGFQGRPRIQTVPVSDFQTQPSNLPLIAKLRHMIHFKIFHPAQSVDSVSRDVKYGTDTQLKRSPTGGFKSLQLISRDCSITC